MGVRRATARGAIAIGRATAREADHARTALRRVAATHAAVVRRTSSASGRAAVRLAAASGRAAAREAAHARTALRRITAAQAATLRSAARPVVARLRALWTVVARIVDRHTAPFRRFANREMSYADAALHRIGATHARLYHRVVRAPERRLAIFRYDRRLAKAERLRSEREETRHWEAILLAEAQRLTAAKQAAQREARRRTAAQRRVTERRTVLRLLAQERARRRRRRRIAIAFLVAVLLGFGGLGGGVYYADAVPTPAELELPESTMVYFADGRTPMAKLGKETRTILAYDDMVEPVKQAIVAAEDRSFWIHDGIDLTGVLRAAWHNVAGGKPQGASTITQQYARIAADLEGLTYSRKLREAVIAWKLDDKYSKKEILAFYLNTVPFGRGAYGVEAAAQAFFGKSASLSAPPERRVTVAEAMLLASLVKQPEPSPVNPDREPGYDPARGGTAAANSRTRWEYVRAGMIELGYLTQADADALDYPTVRDITTLAGLSGMDQPTGLIASHVMSELRQSATFRNKPVDHILSGGYRIVTTIDRRAQEAAEAAADIRRVTAPVAVQGQPANWQAALVAVEPGTGRILAYYGGRSGTGADHAGWFYDDSGRPRGFGQHPPGSSFKIYDLAEALREGIPITSRWDSPATKEFPASGRTRATKAGPIRNSTTAKCQPHCTLWEATVASLNVTFFELTERLGTASVIDMARRAGIDSMWSDRLGKAEATRVDLRNKELTELAQGFTTEVGIGQYGITVLDHANGMATFAAGGKRAQAHFVKEVTKRGDRVYSEQLTQSDVGLSPGQLAELNWTLSQVPSARLPNGWVAAGKTGTWQSAENINRNAHTWMVGYTRALAVAVWLGTTDGHALRTADGKYEVTGSSHAAPIWRQFIVDATAAMGLDPAKQPMATPAVAPSAGRTP